MKRFLVTDNRGQMEIFNKAELELLSLFKFDDGFTVEDYTEEDVAKYERQLERFSSHRQPPRIPFELEILDLYRERVPF